MDKLRQMKMDVENSDEYIFDVSKPAILWLIEQAERAEKQHFEILALEDILVEIKKLIRS